MYNCTRPLQSLEVRYAEWGKILLEACTENNIYFQFSLNLSNFSEECMSSGKTIKFIQIVIGLHPLRQVTIRRLCTVYCSHIS